MDFLKTFINEYGTAILYTVLTALAGYIGMWVKKLYTKYINDKTKQAVAKTVVQAVEQLYNNLNGEEKLEKALESASDMLAEKGINITDLELRILIEAAVSEFNDAFHREQKADFDSIPAGDSSGESDISDFADDIDDAYESGLTVNDDKPPVCEEDCFAPCADCQIGEVAVIETQAKSHAK